MQVNGIDQVSSGSEEAINTRTDMWTRCQHSYLMVFFRYQEIFVKAIGRVSIHVLLRILCDRGLSPSITS